MSMNYEVNDSDHMKEARSLLVGFLAVGFTIFILGGILGVLMRFSQAGLIVIHQNLWYRFLTLHGDAMFVGFGGLVSLGVSFYVVVRALDAPLHSWKLAYVTFWLFVAGVVLVAIGTLVFGFDSSWVFLYPLPFAESNPFLFFKNFDIIVFVLGVVLIGVGIIIGSLELVLTISKNGPGILYCLTFWLKAPSNGEYKFKSGKFPLAVVPVLVNGIGMIIATIPFALLLVWELLEALGLVGALDALLAKNLLWWFGHPIVYQLLFPTAGLYYLLISNATKRQIVGIRMTGFAWFITIIIQNAVWAHHIYSDFAQPVVSHIFMQLTTYVITIPSLVSIFALTATIYVGELKWNTTTRFAVFGIFSWFFAGLQGFMNATVFINNYVHNTLWVPGHFHTMAIMNMVFSYFAITYYVLPRFTGRPISETFSKWHFWLSGISIIGMVHFWLLSGLLGFLRRSYQLPAEAYWLTLGSTPFFFVFGFMQLLFYFMFWKNLLPEPEGAVLEPYPDVAF